jgi:hypothetical protein
MGVKTVCGGCCAFSVHLESITKTVKNVVGDGRLRLIKAQAALPQREGLSGTGTEENSNSSHLVKS